MTRPLIVDGRAVTCRVAIVDEHGRSSSLGLISHEVTAVELIESLPELETDEDEYLVVELWEETERIRWLRDEREVSLEIANVLLDGELEERLEVLLDQIRSTP